MTLDTNALIRDVKREFKSRTNSCRGHDETLSELQSIAVSKSTAYAIACREGGNRLYKERKFQEALIPYTTSAAFAFPDSEELCKAYGNRSAALFQLKEYESCLLDINRALTTHCPNLVLRQKLLDRKKRCVAQIKSSAGVNGVSSEIEDGTNPVERESTRRADMLSKFGNPLLPNASPKIKLKYNEKWGRHFVATADIDPVEALNSVMERKKLDAHISCQKLCQKCKVQGEEGPCEEADLREPLICEEYFIAVASTGVTRFKFCDFCTTMCHAMIPCSSCAKTLYCSEQCRTMAYNQYHRIECKLSVSPIASNNSLEDPIPMRLFLIGTKQGVALESLMNRLSISDIFEEKYNFADKPFTSDYTAALRMIVESFEPISVKSRIKDAVEVVTELRKLAFFENVPNDRLTDAEVFAAALLLNNYRRRHTNLIAIHGIKPTEIGGDGVGEGLVLLQYMMNHSCYPNVCHFRRKRDNIMYSVRPIKKNEQLFGSYCQNFANSPKWERVQSLDFTCQCEACLENWPSLAESGVHFMSSFDLLFMIEDGFLPNYEKGHELLLAELMNITAPLLDDTALLNLELGGIVSVITEMVSLLYKMMKPMSYPLVMLRHFLVNYTSFFYDERERDRSQNEKLSFPLSSGGNNLSELFRMSFLKLVPKEVDRTTAMMTIFHTICRLNFYLKNGHFVNKN